VSDVLGLDWSLFNDGSIEFDGCVNFMKAALVYSDYITTVSETYAQEIQYDYFGEHLQGLIRERSSSLKGIINGIDYDVYNPLTDKKIFDNYDENCTRRKFDNKVKLQEQLGLPVRRDVPMLAIISRLVAAKGLDLVAHIVDELVQNQDVQLVVLGTGDKQYEDMFKHLAWRYPTKVSANIMFDDTLAHCIYAASDIFIMPSQYEPCGIGQLIALKYGSIPVVRETGGLKDTVKYYDKYTNEGNGVTFMNYNAHELLFSIKRALGYLEDANIRKSIRRNGMLSDYSWKASAKIYKDLYETIKSW
jgi:starch synthase